LAKGQQEHPLALQGEVGLLWFGCYNSQPRGKKRANKNQVASTLDSTKRKTATTAEQQRRRKDAEEMEACTSADGTNLASWGKENSNLLHSNGKKTKKATNDGS
jgi:hypothetical protein